MKHFKLARYYMTVPSKRTETLSYATSDYANIN